jgi:subtilisin family serine protease
MKSNALRLLVLFMVLTIVSTPASAHPRTGLIFESSQHRDYAGTPADDQVVRVDPELIEQFASYETSSYLIYFREKADLSPAYQMDWEARGWFVMETLQAVSEDSQKRVRAYLDEQGIDYRTFWIDNVIVVKRSDFATLNGLLTFTEINRLQAEPQVFLFKPETISMAENTLVGVEDNISHVNANDVWNLNITGEGITVASIDTGVRYTHQALVNQYRGNLGGGVFDHNYNWWDPYEISSLPSDENGHGTHTMGIMVGDDGGSNQIGMAPGANWIACRGCDSNSCDGAALYTCGQFMAAPWNLTETNPDPNLRPHVVNNSWGDCDQTYDPWYQGVIDNWHAAGIYPVFANGNAGNCGYPTPPGLGTVVNPARYNNVTGVGSTVYINEQWQYANHSAWGPTDNPDTVNPHGFPTIKPQVVAPGVGIRSSYLSSDDTYTLMTGTSMSAPHVAGLVALMWQAGPHLIGDYSTTETIMQNTASPIPYDTGNGDEGPGNVPNHATGWGEIDALAAVSKSASLMAYPHYLGVTLGIDASITVPLEIKNQSSRDIEFQILISGSGILSVASYETGDPEQLASSGSSSTSWLYADPTAGTIAAMDTQVIQVTFDASVPEGMYQTILFIHNITDNNLLEVDVTLTVVPEALYGLSLQPPNASQSGNPGQTVTHSLTLSNASNVTDTFKITFAGNDWDVHLPEAELILNPEGSTDFLVHVINPVNAPDGTSDSVTITATSNGESSVTAEAVLTTTVEWRSIFLPLILRQ